MSATKLGLVAAAIKTAIDAAAITSRGNALVVYVYEPRDLDTLPAVTIEGPVEMRRSEPDEGESQLGSDDWRMAFTVRLYVNAEDRETAATDSRALLGQVIAAIDADRDLGGEAEIDSSLSRGELGYTPEDATRQMAIYDCTLDVWALI